MPRRPSRSTENMFLKNYQNSSVVVSLQKMGGFKWSPLTFDPCRSFACRKFEKKNPAEIFWFLMKLADFFTAEVSTLTVERKWSMPKYGSFFCFCNFEVLWQKKRVKKPQN